MSLYAAVAFADIVHLKNGRQVIGKIIKETEKGIQVEIPGGEVFIDAANIKKIDKGVGVAEGFSEEKTSMVSDAPLSSADYSQQQVDNKRDISPEAAVAIIKEYENAYTNKDLDKMLAYVDQNSEWFKRGFLEEFKAVFQNFTSIHLYHFDKKVVAYIKDGIEVMQRTLYVAYSRKLTDINEFAEDYYLKKVDGKYKIADCIHLPAEDVKLVDQGTAAMLENNAVKAIDYFKKAISINPNNSAAHFRLGMLYFATKRFPESLQSLKKAAKLRPEVGFYRFYLYHAYKALGDKNAALTQLAIAIKFDPDLESLAE